MADNPALDSIADRPVLPVYVLDETAAGAWTPGGAARWWLHHSLAALGADLAARGAPLLLARGSAEIIIPALAQAVGAAEVLAGRLHEPWARERDQRVAEALAADGRRLRLATSAVLHEPARVKSGSGQPYAVYTPFARAVAALGEPDPPLPAPARLHPMPSPPPGEVLADWALLPRDPDWAAAFPAAWMPGEAGGAARLARFVAGPVAQYAARRNLPGLAGTSGLSPHLHWGEVSPRQLWHAVRAALPAEPADASPFLSELLWREFSYHLLWHRPTMPEQPLRPRFTGFPCRGMQRCCAPGSAARPASRSSMPACGSSGSSAGCTTGCG
ncbi:deoxyribodipyrimidine photo-lyase [Siccirubricoccus deserti]|uniref:deoxyribodipyrimidine photo-lyase n=1 Tax=Siccirubricoccus deserti TaxID=2013562 RepID=UPI0028F6DFB3|nr:deoxyribodipyrimidine photo-lyase [Siccirubricoccus deserti]